MADGPDEADADRDPERDRDPGQQARALEQPAEVEARQVGHDVEARQDVLRQREAEERQRRDRVEDGHHASEAASVVYVADVILLLSERTAGRRRPRVRG